MRDNLHADSDRTRIELQTQLFQARTECERLENEVAGLLQSNQQAIVENHDLKKQLDFARKTGLDSIQAVQNELARKLEHSHSTD